MDNGEKSRDREGGERKESKTKSKKREKRKEKSLKSE